MTAIAAFNVDSCPVVFGDLLLTGECDSVRAVAVPAVGEVNNFFENSGWSILGLRQKVVLINEHCVLAWAGSWLGAKLAIDELRTIAANTTLTRDGVCAFLASHHEANALGTSFVGWVHEEEHGRVGQFRHEAEIINAGSLGRMSVQGTGTDAIKELVDLWKGMQWKETGEVNSGTRAVSTGLAMSGILLRSELHGGDAAPTLRSMFGGGYEVATFSNGHFHKAGNLTFLIWSAMVNSDGVRLTLPQLIVKQAYIDDVLLLRSARITSEGNDPPKLIDEQRHVILPMYNTEARVSQQALNSISLNSNLLCHCFLVEGEGDGDLMIYTRVQQTGHATTPTLELQDEDDRLILGFSDAFIREVGHSLQDGMARCP